MIQTCNYSRVNESMVNGLNELPSTGVVTDTGTDTESGVIDISFRCCYRRSYECSKGTYIVPGTNEVLSACIFLL